MKNRKTLKKRRHERIPSNIIVKFINDDRLYYGIAKNVSEGGMCISTGYCLPCETCSSVLIPVGDDHIELNFRVRWAKKTGDFYDIMGIELIEIDREYMRLIQNLRSDTGV